MKNNVVQFPENKSLRKRLMDRSQDQKAVLGLSIASVLVVTVFMNELLFVKKSDQFQLNAQGRQIASLDQASLAKDIKWEHSIASKMAQDDLKAPVQLAEKPTIKDELVFGYLQGKYGVKVVQGKIHSIEFLNAMAGDQPLKIENKIEFLKKYSTVFQFPFQEASLKAQGTNSEMYTLVDSAKTIVGQAEFLYDHEGRLLALKLQQ